ncbi:MAG TPA: type II toxin-antitoxin system Phd/YefM family antitoxin [Microlunatus sp.]
MSTVSVTAARGQLPEVLERSRTEAVLLEKRGAVVAVIVSPEFYHRALDALEEAEDVAAFDAAIAEEGPDLPWAQVKADLGWI